MSSNRQKTVTAEKPDPVPPRRVGKQCACGMWFTLPACHADRHQSCSEECRDRALDQSKQARAVPCAQCEKQFVPRPWQIRNGIGRFCSQSCATRSFRLSDAGKEVAKRSGQTYKKSLAEGKFTRATGEDHPQWSGGPEAARARQIASGKSAARIRKYRKENPERARGWAQKRRANSDCPRLPWGTVQKLIKLQKGCCAICKAKVGGKYHLDHIMPLKLGGKHEPKNLQILCPTCNVRKSAKHPIRYAQERGMLL